jgi:hypothetical protein
MGLKLTRLTLPCGPAKTRIAGNAETSRSWACHPCTRSYVSDCRFSSDLASRATRDLRTGQKGVTTTGRHLLKLSGHCWTNAFKADLCGLVQRHISAADPTSRSSLSVEMSTNPVTDAQRPQPWPYEFRGPRPVPDQHKPAGYRREGPLSNSARIGDGLNPLTMR